MLWIKVQLKFKTFFSIICHWIESVMWHDMLLVVEASLDELFCWFLVTSVQSWLFLIIFSVILFFYFFVSSQMFFHFFPPFCFCVDDLSFVISSWNVVQKLSLYYFIVVRCTLCSHARFLTKCQISSYITWFYIFLLSSENENIFFLHV